MKRYAHRQFPQVLLCSRKRDELTFSFRISSLHQLVVCRHASGADSDGVVNNQICLSQSTMRALAIVLFLLPESTRRMRYVHCLCCCLPNGLSPDYPALRGKEKDCVHNMTVAWRGNKTWVPYVELGWWFICERWQNLSWYLGDALSRRYYLQTLIIFFDKNKDIQWE